MTNGRMQTERTAVGRWLTQILPTVLALGAVVWFYQWTVRTSGGFNPPGEEDYYHFLVRGWQQGHLYLAKEPRPEMLALADPWDPVRNAAWRMGDASYFRGHHYLYFGAAPALLVMWPYGVITGQPMGTTTAVFVFCTLGYLAMAGGWLAVRRRYFPDSAWWVAPAGVLVLGFGSQVLALARRPLVWELPIAAGFAFLMLAVVAAGLALHARRPARWMALSGLMLGCAVASRPTTVLAAAMFVPVLWYVWRTAPGQWWRCALGTAATLGLCIGAVLAHNAARFGNPLEFGQNYQLSVIYESKMRHFSPSYVLHNLFIYFGNAPSWSRAFPFLTSKVIGGGPPGYLDICVEGICGVAVTFPGLWLAVAAPLVWWRREAPEMVRLRALVAVIAVVMATQTAVILGYFVAMVRYAADFGPALAVLAVLGLLGVERWVRQRRGAGVVNALMILAVVATVVAGVLVSFDYHHQMLKTLWPDGWRNLESWFKR